MHNLFFMSELDKGFHARAVADPEIKGGGGGGCSQKGAWPLFQKKFQTMGEVSIVSCRISGGWAPTPLICHCHTSISFNKNTRYVYVLCICNYGLLIFFVWRGGGGLKVPLRVVIGLKEPVA